MNDDTDDTDDTERVDIVAADILANALQELNMLDTGKFGRGGHRYTVDNTGFVRRGEATELSPYAHVEAALMVALTRLAGAPERVEELRRHLFDGDTADVLASCGRPGRRTPTARRTAPGMTLTTRQRR